MTDIQDSEYVFRHSAKPPKYLKSCFDDITVCEKEAHNLFETMCESCLEPCHLGEVLENFLGEVQN